MSNKPNIFATCKAGCLWEVPHKADVNDNFAKVRQEMFDKVIESGNILLASGSYVGTGEDLSLTFDFVPKLIFILSGGLSSYRIDAIELVLMPEANLGVMNFNETVPNSTEDVRTTRTSSFYVSVTGNTITTSAHTANISGCGYSYLAIGGSSGAGNSVVTVYNENTWAFTLNENMGLYLFQTAGELFPLVEGETYLVAWDGMVSECVAKSMPLGTTEGVGIGNFGLVGGEDTGEEFLIGVTKDGTATGCYTASTKASHTVRIYQNIKSYIDAYMISALEGEY